MPFSKILAGVGVVFLGAGTVPAAGAATTTELFQPTSIDQSVERSWRLRHADELTRTDRAATPWIAETEASPDPNARPDAPERRSKKRAQGILFDRGGTAAGGGGTGVWNRASSRDASRDRALRLRGGSPEL